MRATLKSTLGLTLAFLLAAATLARSEGDAKPAPNDRSKAQHLGTGESYSALGEISVLHKGRIKPLDTYARLEIKELHGRDQIKLLDSEGKPSETWSALGALMDIPARPRYWDEQEVLLIDLWDYRGMKQTLLASAIKSDLKAILANANASSAERAALEPLVEQESVAEKDLVSALKKLGKTLPDDSRAKLTGWAEKLAEGRKWISPADLERAELSDGDHTHEFLDYFRELFNRGREGRRSGRAVEFTPREQRVITLGERLLQYQAFRDGNELEEREFDLGIVPRPSSAEYLAFTGKTINRLVSRELAPEAMDPLERDVFDTLTNYLTDLKSVSTYLRDVQEGKQKPPGADPKFDGSYAKWLRESAGWIPLRVLLGANPEKLAEAGLPTESVERLKKAYAAVVSAEAAAPGKVELASANELLAATRAIGEATNPTRFPSAAAMRRETHFNQFAPFVKAQWVYGLSLVLLLISLGLQAPRGAAMGRVERFTYLGGLLAFVAGIGLEIYGFYLRVAISGWAPVTNMYETVIWVAFGAAVLGLVLELIFRRKFAATAAAGVATLATVLAANVPLLDSNIGSLTPVLRDNYWLSVHVLTIVSSYAAFTLVLGLGMLGIAYYLSATYRGDASYALLARPLIWGLPVFAVGILLNVAASRRVIPIDASALNALSLACLAIGGLVSGVGVFSLLGELANRHSKGALGLGLSMLVVGLAGAWMLHGKTAPAGWPAWLPMDFVPGTLALTGFGVAVMSQLGGRSRELLMAAQPAHATGHAMADVVDADHVGASASNGFEYSAAQSGGGTAVATRARPSVREILSKAGRPPDLKNPRDAAIRFTASQIKPLSNFIYRAMQVGVLLVAAGTILGGVWADVSWGRFWGWDPKEVWALITLLVYLIPLHGRFAGWVSTFGLVGASVVCYLSVLMAWYGVNFVLGVGLHTYGFTDGGGQGVVFTSVGIVLAIVIATAYRRHLATRAAV